MRTELHRTERAPFGPKPLDIAVLGLLTSPTATMSAPHRGLALIPELKLIARAITAWDPLLAGDMVGGLFPFIRRVTSPAEAVREADVVLVLTSYPEVMDARWVAALKTGAEPVIVVDAANCLEAGPVAAKGAVYRAIGIPRETVPSCVKPPHPA